jgi:prolipoprotein diacylglyceryl transferase
MRPVLFEIPSKLLFFAALALALGFFVWGRWKGRASPRAASAASNVPYLLAGAVALVKLRGGAWLPTAEVLSRPWLAVPIHSYGVMLGTSMIVGWFLAMKLSKQDGIPEEQAGAIYMWTAVWSIVGARVLYIIANHDKLDGALDALKIWNGGLVAYGGMIGGFLTSWYCCWKRKIPLLRWADVAAPSVVLGTSITRVGCLLFGCDYGRRTALPWGIRFPAHSPAWQDQVKLEHLPATAAWSYPVHPTQIYELLAGLFLFGLMMLARRVRTFSGQVFLTWVLGYGILRPIIEIFRDDKERGTVGPLSTSQFIGMVSVVLGTILLVQLVKRNRQDPEALRLWEAPLEVATPAAAAPVRGGHRRRRGAR